ncbi:MAG: ABC transporter permease [Pseudomonadota bacterium]|nr:ABC transporter permease [Pseudomonadota bacterium]
MRIRFEKRRELSRVMLVLSPIGAVAATMIVGAIIFEAIGYDGPDAVKDIFFTPVLASYKWQDVAAKAAPLILIALGLTLGNQAKVWNIGAEGQYILGALGGAGVAILTQDMQGWWIVPLMIVSGMAAGALWAAPVAWLRNRYGVNEILSSLMLVYVAAQLLNYLVTGPWKDPHGQNFPQTAPFTASQRLPAALFGQPFPPGLYIAFALALVFWLVMARTEYGLGIRVVGEAPRAARYAGYRASDAVWSTLLISGAMAGLAGVLEATTQSGQLNLGFPSGYGFTAIIVSFLGRLHPIGIALAGVVLAISYVGGQVAQTTVHVPSATAGIFQAMMLFFILASDVLVRRRLRIEWGAGQAKAARA